MAEERPQLTPAALNDFIKRVQSDPELRKRAVGSIGSKGLAGMAEEFFALNEKQRTNLSAQSKNNQSSQKLVADSVRSAFETGGSVRLVDPTETLIAGFHVGVHVGSNGSVDVDIGCAL